MEVFFKKYFWVVHLVVLGICGIFAGRAGAHFLEGALLISEEPMHSVRRTAYTPPPKEHSKDPEPIIKRNIFCSGCAPVVPAADSKEFVGEQKTTLQLELVSTMVCPTDDAWSVAVIRDLSTKEKEPVMVARGTTIANTSAKVDRVVPRKIYLVHDGRREFLEMEGGPPVPAAAPAVAAAAPPAEGGDLEVGKSVQCTGNSCTVERALVEKMLSNTAMLATAARFVPSMKDGKPNGFKLYAIRPNSIFGRIGLQNGDTIKAINGNEMTTPDAALGLYSKLRNASHLSVQVDRRGETVALDYTIR